MTDQELKLLENALQAKCETFFAWMFMTVVTALFLFVVALMIKNRKDL